MVALAAVNEQGALPLPWLEGPVVQTLAHARSHALLVQGPMGVGQFDMGLVLAQSWLCESPQGSGLACGRCSSCHLFHGGTHPDFQVLVPDALRERLGLSSDEGDSGKDGEGKASKAKPSREIKVEAVRQMLSFAQTTTARGRAKVVLIYPAEALNTVAANALLKTLEEPGGLLRFVLASAAPQALLPTIRSRCQSVNLGLPAHEQALTWLQQQGVVDAEVLLRATGGRPQEALQWAEEGVQAQAWVQLPLRLSKAEAAAVSDWPVPRAIDALQRIVNDLLRRVHGAPAIYFPESALPKVRQAAPLHDWAEQLKQAARHADHPLNSGLFMESLFCQGRDALRLACRVL